jgi:thymidylate synthase (FAD)
MHEITKEAEEILDKEFPVLDHGFVRLVDYMGGDSAIVQAARVSYGEGTKTVSEDRGLIRYLTRNEHTSPLEMVEMKFHCKMPIFVARQWVRHRTANLNEISGRYSIMRDEFYIPEPQQINLQSKNNKQGRSEETFSSEETEEMLFNFAEEQRRGYKSYTERIEKGMARELARINLPLSLYTEWYWKIDLHNLFHFLDLRMDEHAQVEIRNYANTIFDITKKVAPKACEAFEHYQLNSEKFSYEELKIIKKLLGDTDTEDISLFEDTSFVKDDKGNLTSEGKEFKEKLRRILER